jgi:hypothetical protein
VHCTKKMIDRSDIEVPRVWKQNDAPCCKIELVVVSTEQRFASGLVHDKMFSPYISAVILLVERHAKVVNWHWQLLCTEVSFCHK